MEKIEKPNSFYHLAGTIRARKPEETLSYLKPLLKKFGITRLANITGLDRIGIPVWVAIRPNGKNLSTAQGKGITPELAQVSALMESIEVWHAENLPKGKITGSYIELNNGKTSRYQKKKFLNPKLLEIHGIQIGNLQTKILNWVETTELFSNQKVWLPHAEFSLDSTQFDAVTYVFATASNGLASGNTFAEAMIHSLCELIERDSVERWFALSENAQAKTLISLSQIPFISVKDLIRKIHQKGFELYVWDVTGRTGIPTYYVSLVECKTLPNSLFVGTGAHLDPEIALLRAITESAQARLSYINGSRDDIFPDQYQYDDARELIASLQAQKPNPKILFSKTKLPSALEDIPLILLEKLHAAGVRQLYCYNHTRSDFDLPVVHIITPDLLRMTV